jgi:glycosyltransferase involved in cell wall biosynthesis
MKKHKIKTIGIIWENLEFGGVSTFLENLINSQSFKLINFVIFTNKSNLDSARIKKNFKNKNVKIVYFNSLNTLQFNNYLLKVLYLIGRPIFFIFSILQFLILLRNYTFDIFIANCGGFGNFRSEIAALISCKILRYPIKTLLIHHSYTKPIFWKFLIDIIDLYISRIITNFIFVSRATKNNIKKNTKLLSGNKPFEIIYQGIEVLKDKKSNYLLSKIFKKNKKKNIVKIGMLSRIEPNKGQSDLIAAVKEISPDLRKNIKIYLIGSGQKNYIEKIRLEIKSNSLEDLFNITGYIDCNSLNIISELDLLVSLTKDFEGFGITCAQGLLIKKPILATNVGAIPEFLNNQNARLINPSNKEEIKKAIIDFLKNKNKWKKKAANGSRKIKEKFDITVTSKKYYFYLSSLLLKNNKTL